MRKILTLFAFFTAAALAAAEYTIKVTTSAPSGVVKCNELVIFTAQALVDGKPAPADMILEVQEYISGTGRKIVKQSADKTYTFKHAMAEPGRMYIRCFLFGGASKKKSLLLNVGLPKPKKMTGTGVYAAPEAQRIARPEPADFDAVWDKYKAELVQIPVKVLEKKPLNNSKAGGAKADMAKKLKIDVYDMKIASPGGKNVSGILCVPQDKSRKYPAIVSFHGAGVRSAGAKLNSDAITFDVNAHGLPNLMPHKYYSNIMDKKSPYAGTADYKAEMFRGMFMRVLRSLEFIRTLPEWNGKDLIVTGGSQGGVQTIVAAAQDKYVSLAVPTIPAMVGVAEFIQKKNVESTWPSPYVKDYQAGKDVTAAAKKFDYLDGAFHLRRVKCPIYVAVGMFDHHAAHVAAAMNDCPSKEKVFTYNIYFGHTAINKPGVRAINKVLDAAKKESVKK